MYKQKTASVIHSASDEYYNSFSFKFYHIPSRSR